MDNSMGDQGQAASASALPATETLIMMVGDDGETGLIVMASLLERLIRRSPNLLLFMAEKKKTGRLAQSPCKVEYEALSDRAKALGGTIECVVTTTGKSKYDVAAECASIARRVQGGIFCFYNWGLSDVKPDLKDELEAAGLNTAYLPNLFQSAGGES